MMEAPALRIASRPNADHDNPYFRLLYGALSKYQIEHRGLFSLNDDWLRQNAAELDAIHIHWPEYLWRVDGRTSPRAIVGFVRFLRLAKRLRLVRVWTVHNLPPHEPQLADLAGLWLLAREIDIFVCHSLDVAARVSRWLRPPPASSLVIMRIGNYDGTYPPPQDSAAFARSVGIPPDKSIVAVLGRLRTYKGIEIAIQAAGLLPESMHVVIAGRVVGDIGHIRRLVASSAGRVTLIDRDLTDQEVSTFLELSDAMWLPYRRISTSATLLLALTAGRGVIATDLPFFREMLTGADDAGRLVRPGDPAALAESTVAYLALPEKRREAAARGLADRFAWEDVVRDFAETLRARAHREH